MKQLHEMTEAELCALTEDDIDKLVKLECAQRGVPLSSREMPPVAIPPAIEPDVITYEVAGRSYMEREQADAVAAIMNKFPVAELKRDWTDNSQLATTFTGVVIDVVSVVEQRHFSQVNKAAFSAELEQHAAQRKAYDAALKESQAVAEQIHEVRAQVRRAIGAARLSEAERDLAEERLAEYMALAEDDGPIAVAFFEKTYPGTLDKYPDLRSRVLAPRERLTPPELPEGSVDMSDVRYSDWSAGR